MSTTRRALTALAIAGVLAACGGGESAAPSLDGDIEASAEPVEEDESEEPSEVESTEEATSPAEEEPSPEEPTDEESSPVDDEPGTAAVDPEEACTVTADEARIEVVAPAEGDTVGQTFRLAGCGNTFEATYLWEFELDDGTAAGGGFGTMTCGTGCVGTFDEEVTVDATGSGVLRVFEESAEDGSRVNVIEVPITVDP